MPVITIGTASNLFVAVHNNNNNIIIIIISMNCCTVHRNYNN